MKPILTLVALGDSLTYSGRSPIGQTYTDALEAELNRRLTAVADVIVVNAGVGSDTAEGGLARFDDYVLAHEPDAVFLEFGGNDSRNFDPEWFGRSLTALAAAVRSRTRALLFMATPPYINESRHSFRNKPEFIERGGLNAFLQGELAPKVHDAAKRYHAPVFDLYGETAKALHKGYDMLRPDGIHWTAEGNRVLAHAVADFAEPHLRDTARRKTADAEGMDPLVEAERALAIAKGDPFLTLIFPPDVQEGNGPPYPLSVLEQMQGNTAGLFPPERAHLLKIRTWSRRASLMSARATGEQRARQQQITREADFITALAGIFLALIRIRYGVYQARGETGCGNGPDNPFMAAAVRSAETLPEVFASHAHGGARRLGDFLLQLRCDVLEAARGNRAPAAVRWSLEGEQAGETQEPPSSP